MTNGDVLHEKHEQRPVVRGHLNITSERLDELKRKYHPVKGKMSAGENKDDLKK